MSARNEHPTNPPPVTLASVQQARRLTEDDLTRLKAVCDNLRSFIHDTDEDRSNLLPVLQLLDSMTTKGQAMLEQILQVEAKMKQGEN